MDKTNLDLSMQSIEHVGKMKEDMIVELHASEKMKYFQRIQNNDSYDIQQLNSAIDILYKESEAMEENNNIVELEYEVMRYRVNTMINIFYIYIKGKSYFYVTTYLYNVNERYDCIPMYDVQQCHSRGI